MSKLLLSWWILRVSLIELRSILEILITPLRLYSERFNQERKTHPKDV